MRELLALRRMDDIPFRGVRDIEASASQPASTSMYVYVSVMTT